MVGFIVQFFKNIEYLFVKMIYPVFIDDYGITKQLCIINLYQIDFNADQIKFHYKYLEFLTRNDYFQNEMNIDTESEFKMIIVVVLEDILFC